MRTLRFILVICLAACLSCTKVSPSPIPSGQAPHSSRSQHRVALASGAYRGLHDPTTRSTVYYGIPYARAGRFKKPIPVEEDTSTVKQTRDAAQHGPACTNFNIPPPYDEGFKELLGLAPIAPQSEDCLTMDVYVPDGAQTCDHQLPVLVFIAGGGFLNGASFIYDLRPMLEKAIDLDKPFIGVVIQYRLGPFGFLNPSTRLDDFNLGLLDQREALRYVRDNIAAFGGDRSRVTLMGQSAGAQSSLYQLLFASAEEQLFHSIWLASVPSTAAPFLQTETHSMDDIIAAVAEAAGCPANVTVDENVVCLEKVDAQKLVNVSTDAWQGSGPSLGGLVSENVFERIASKRYPDIPTVVSSCRDEGTSSAIGFKADNDEASALGVQILINTAHRFDEEQAKKIVEDMLSAYPNDPARGAPFDGRNTTYGEPSQYKRLSAIDTDSTYTAAWLDYLSAFSSHSSRSKVWGLLFQEPIPATSEAMGVQHGSDLTFYFPTLLPDNDPRKFGKTSVVDALHTSLIHFVHCGNPAAQDDGDKWSLYNEAHGSTQVTSIGGRGNESIRTIAPPYRSGFDVIRRYFRP